MHLTTRIIAIFSSMLQILVMYSIWNMEYAKHFFLHAVVDHNTLDRFLLLMLKRTLPEKKIPVNYTCWCWYQFNNYKN